MMAAYINEIHADPLFGTRAEDQYIELRGEPNAVLAANTYFVSISSVDGVTELGDIQSIFNLSGQAFGANGLLVLMQSAGGYTVDSGARLLKGNDGFQGIAGGIFSADGIAKEIRSGTTTYLLIQAPVAPTLTTDIDLNDDGTPETAYPNWTILDGVSVSVWVEGIFPQKAYAPIVFRERASGASMPGSTVVDTSQIAYVGRIGESTGYAANDWLVGNTVETANSSWQFQFQHGVFGTPLPVPYGGRILDHVGAPNWYGSVSGSVFRDDNKDGIQQASEPPLDGVSVFADPGNAPVSSFITERIEPNEYATGSDVSNISPNVTLISAGSDNVPQGFKIRPSQRFSAPTGEHVFSHENVGFFNNNRRLRMDFYRPARSVSIDVIGDSSTPTYGRLEIYNAAGQSLGFVRSSALGAGALQRLTMSSSDNIAWAVAYSDESHLNSSPFGMLDNLTFQLAPISVTTNVNGSYRVGSLPPNRYTIRAATPATYEQVFPAGNGVHTRTIGKYESYNGVNFGFAGNQPPRMADQEFTVSESQIPRAVLANLPIQRGYPSQQVLATITSGDPASLFRIDTANSQLVLEKAELDFESLNTIVLAVKLEDAKRPDLNSTATIRLNISDANEPPIVTPQSTTLEEHSPAGSKVTTMKAVDPDAGVAGQFDWSIVSGNSSNAFSIDPVTGAVQVAKSEAVDFEVTSKHTLRIRATDRGTPAMTGEANLEVMLIGVNEPPHIPPQKLIIAENSPSGTLAGQVVVVDPDGNQNMNWSITGGTGAGLFDIEPSSGKVSLKNGATLDYESVKSVELAVNVTDSGSPPLSGNGLITISITDANDPPAINAKPFTISEGAVGGSEVGTITASDQDPGQTITYSLVTSPDAASFTIEPATGKITLVAAPSLDFETRPTLLFQVQATDSGSPAASSRATVTVNLTNVNDAPVLAGATLSVAENSLPGTKIGIIPGSDPDAGDTITFAISKQASNWFAIDKTTGDLSVNSGAALDFEASSSLEVEVEVKDVAGLAATRTYSVRVMDGNDPPRLANPLPDVNTLEGTLFQMSIPATTFADQDASDTIALVVTTADGFRPPTWLSFDAKTKVLSGSPTLADVGKLDLRVTAVDNSGATASDTFVITVGARIPWQNSSNVMDVNADRSVSPIDALLIINYLNQGLPSKVQLDSTPSQGFLDTSGDNFVTPIDALLVINFLNVRAGNGEGAGYGVEAPELEAFFDWSRIEEYRKRLNRLAGILAEDDRKS